MTRRRLRIVNVLLLVVLLAAQAMAVLPRPVPAYADEPPLRVRLVPPKDSPERLAYDRQNVQTWPDSFPKGGGGGLLSAIGSWFADRWNEAKSLWSDLFSEDESGSLLSRLKGILIGFVKGLIDFGKGLVDLAKQLLSLLWDFLLHPAQALERIKGMITGVIESIKDAFNGLRDALSADPPDFGEGAMEVGIMLGYQAIVDCVRSGLFGQAIGRGLFELVATFGPGALARAGGKVADVFVRAGEMAGGALSKLKDVTEAKSWALNALRDARAALPFAKTRRIMAAMVDERFAPGQLQTYYADLPKTFGDSAYLKDNLGDLEQLARDCVQQGQGSPPCARMDGHFNNIRGEYREKRLRAASDAYYGNRSRIADHPINGNGWDDFRSSTIDEKTGAQRYVFGEAKDVTKDGNVDQATLEAVVQPGSIPPRLNGQGFNDRLDLLEQQGVIDATERQAIVKAFETGDVEIVIFAGGTASPFIRRFQGLSALQNPFVDASGNALPDVPVRVVTDK